VAKLENYQTTGPLNRLEIEKQSSKMVNALQEKLAERDIDYTATTGLMTNYLVGLTMPWFTRFKFRQLGGFGSCELSRYEQVKASVEEIQKSR
jgi:ATP-dependent DNA helicase RecQ